MDTDRHIDTTRLSPKTHVQRTKIVKNAVADSNTVTQATTTFTQAGTLQVFLRSTGAELANAAALSGTTMNVSVISK